MNKTNKSAAKRYSLTATGRVKHKKPGLRHNIGKKRPKFNLDRRQTGYLQEGNAKWVRKLLPYGSLI